jgi:hypothetical protein
MEELLSAFDASPEGEQKSEAESKPAGESKPQNPVADLRKFAETVLKEKKAADKQNADLRKEVEAFRAEREVAVFEKLGLDEKKQKVFKALNPDTPTTEEALATFMQEYYGDSEGEEGDTVPTPVPTAPGFKPTPTGSPAPGKTYTSEEIISLIMSGRSEEAHEIVSRATKNPALITFSHSDKMPA